MAKRNPRPAVHRQKQLRDGSVTQSILISCDADFRQSKKSRSINPLKSFTIQMAYEEHVVHLPSLSYCVRNDAHQITLACHFYSQHLSNPRLMSKRCMFTRFSEMT